jgi:hypothetical protein
VAKPVQGASIASAQRLAARIGNPLGTPGILGSGQQMQPAALFDNTGFTA